MTVALLLTVSLMASKGPTTLLFCGGERSAWQQVTANGQILGSVPGTPLAPKTPNCYGLWRLADGSIAAALDHFYLLSADLKRKSGGSVTVETIAGASGNHLYRIRRGQKLKRKPPQIEYSAHLDEISPRTWKTTRSWLLPGVYSAFGSGHLSVSHDESIAYYATERNPLTLAVEAMGTIHRMDLVKGEALPDLASRNVGSGGLQVLAGGSVVVGYTDRTHRYAPDGELLQTTVGALRVGQGLVTASSDASSFWVQGFSDNAPYSTLFDVAFDGTVRHEWNTPNNGVQWDAPFVDPPPTACVPAGSLAFTSLVPAAGSDGDPAPIAYFSGTDGAFLGFSGANITQAGVNGQSQIADNGDIYTENQEAYRDCSLEEFTGSPTESGNGRFSPPNTGTYGDLFFSKGTPNKFLALNHDGTLNHSFANQSIPSVAGVTSLMGAASGTVGYYAKSLAGFAPFRVAVGRWDLVNDVAMSDLTSEANHEIRSGSGGSTHQILVLRDETILVGWVPRSGAGAQVNMIKHYATDGTLLHTYNMSTATAARDSLLLNQDVSGSDTFWVSYYGTTGPLSGHSGETGSFPTYDYSRATKIRISDGAFLVDFAWSNQTVQDFYDTYDYIWSPDIGFWATREDCNCVMACPDPCEDAMIGEPYYALNPEGREVYIYGRNWNLLFTVNAPPTYPTAIAVQLAPANDGVWIAYDNAIGSNSVLAFASAQDDYAITRVITTEAGITIGELSGYHAMFLLSCDRMLTVNRTTHDVITLCLPREDAVSQVALVETVHSLNVDPFDAQLVDGGLNIFYLESGSAKLFNLRNDALLRTIGAMSGIWPVVLSNNSVLTFDGAFRTNGDLLLYSRTGTLLRRLPYDHAAFSVGAWNITGDIETDACDCGNAKDGRGIVVGEDDPGAMALHLLDGSPVGALTPSFGISVIENSIDTATALVNLANLNNGSGFSDQTGGTVRRPTPNRHCGPEAGISSPAPNPGCNDGGKGWTRSYTGASGTVPTASDPSGEETMTGVRSAFIRVKVRHTEYPQGSPAGEETICCAKVDLPSNDDDLVTHPHAEPRVLSIGDDDRGLSDGQGNLVSGSTHIQFMDGDGRPFGIKLTSPTQKYWTRDELVLEAVTPLGLATNATPRRIGTGLVYGERYGGPVVFGLTAVDPLFIEGGSFGPDKKVPQWNYPLDYYTDAPSDLAQVPMPFYYGEKSDEGAVSPVTGVVNSRGLCTVRYVGTWTLGTAAGGATWGRFNICLFACYDIIALYGSDLGGLDLYGAAASVSSIEPIESEDPEAIAETTLVTLDGSPDLSQVATDGTMQIVLFTTTGRTEAAIIGVDNFAKTVSIETPIDAAVATNVPWYLSSIDYVPRRVKIDLATRNGVDVQVPHNAGYIRPTPYEDIYSPAHGTMRVTDMGATGALLAAHLNGEVTLAVNLIGIESEGDGSGLPLTDYFVAFNHFVDNFIHVQSPIPTGAGNLWPQSAAELPQFSDGFSKTKQSSFVAAQAISADGIGGDGLKVNAAFTEAISTRDAMQLWIENGACKAGIDEYGRFYVWLLDQDVDTSAWPKLTHVSRVFGGPPDRTRALDEAFNHYKGGCDYDPEGQAFREDDLKAVSDDAITRNKGFVRPAKHYDLKLLGDTSHAQWVLDRNLLVNQDGPHYIVIQGMDWGVLDIPIGTGFFFSSPSLPGPTSEGMVEQPLLMLHRTFDMDSGLATVTCLDLESESAGGSLLTPEALRMIATDDDAEAPLATDDDVEAPRAA